MRVKILSAILKAIYDTVEGMIHGSTCRANGDRARSKGMDQDVNATGKQCTNHNFGTIIRYLDERDYWPPITNGHALQTSINEVVGTMSNIPAIALSGPERGGTSVLNGGLAGRASIHAVCDVGRVIAERVAEERDGLDRSWMWGVSKAIREKGRGLGLEAGGRR